MKIPPNPTEIATDVAFERYHNSVVQIIGYTRRRGLPTKKEFLGSGFIIGKKEEVTRTCLVLTCDHVLMHEYDFVRVRLSNTNEDLVATAVQRDEEFDLAVLIVQGNFNALHPPIELTNGMAYNITAGTLAALVSYYNPRGLRLQLRLKK